MLDYLYHSLTAIKISTSEARSVKDRTNIIVESEKNKNQLQ